MVKLADTQRSGRCERKLVGVQVSLPAPYYGTGVSAQSGSASGGQVSLPALSCVPNPLYYSLTVGLLLNEKHELAFSKRSTNLLLFIYDY